MITVSISKEQTRNQLPSLILKPSNYEEYSALENLLKGNWYDYSVTEQHFEVDMTRIDELNKDLNAVKAEFKIDDSFKVWIQERNKNNVSPLLIRCGVIFSRIYKNSTYDIPHKHIEEVCKYFFLPAVRQKRYIEKKWDGYIHLYKRYLHEFPTGLLDRVCKVLDERKIPYKIEYIYEREPVKQFEWEPIDLFEVAEDQYDAINSALHGLRGIVKAPTGFGKTSALARYLTAHRGVPTLFVANKKTLLDDAAKDFVEGIEGLEESDVGRIKDGLFGHVKITKDTMDIPLLREKVIVATIQSLSARLKDPRTAPQLVHWLNNICKFVMVDETQAVGTTQWDEVLEQIRAPYRIFLSATPKRQDGATLKINAYSGPVLFTTTAEEQIKKGRLCELDITYDVFNHGAYDDNDTDILYSDEYKAKIVENTERNWKIVKSAFDMLEEERFVLVLIQHIDHGQIIKNMMMEAGISPNDIRFVWGETKDSIRTDAIEDFRQGKFKILIGSTIMDAGVNVPIISGVILAGAGNSEITLIQRIGRGARNCDYEKILGYQPLFMKNNNGIKVTKIIDILDSNTKFFTKQAKNRYFNAISEFGKSRVHIKGGDTSLFFRKKKTTDIDKSIIDTDLSKNELFAAFKDKNKELAEQDFANTFRV